MGGEKRKISMIMTDLRGFTSLSERLPPQRVVALLNRYLTTMVSVIKQYQGTIDEFIGDAIFVLFGAPLWQEDDAQRAVACAVAMQLAMAAINEQNREEDLPEIEMGIGVHTGQVVVGNIGSPERMKYGVVGSHVNLTSRIQSYTTGGQILISEATRQEVGQILRLGKQSEVKAKGIEHPITLFEVFGIGGKHKLQLTDIAETSGAVGGRDPRALRGARGQSGERQNSQRRPHQGLAQGGRGAAGSTGTEFEQSQDASHRQRRQGDPRNALWQGDGRGCWQQHRLRHPLHRGIARDRDPAAWAYGQHRAGRRGGSSSKPRAP